MPVLDGFDQHFQSTIHFHQTRASATSIIFFSLNKFWECREMNLGQLGPEEKYADYRAMYLCLTLMSRLGLILTTFIFEAKMAQILLCPVSSHPLGTERRWLLTF